MRQKLIIAILTAVIFICTALFIVAGGRQAAFLVVWNLLAISAVSFIAGFFSSISRRLVLACLCLTTGAAWMLAIFLDTATPNALDSVNLQSCILMTLLSVISLTAGWLLVGLCMRLGLALKQRAVCDQQKSLMNGTVQPKKSPDGSADSSNRLRTARTPSPAAV